MATFSRPIFLAALATVLAVALGACASPGDDDATSSPPASPADPTAGTAASEAPTATPPGDASAQCNAAAAKAFVGREATEATVAEAQTAAGATGAVRVIKPGQPVTMDFRGDRLNIEVDERNGIVRITCG